MSATDSTTLPGNGAAPAQAPDDQSMAITDGSIRCRLDDRGLLSLQGADAATFLHGQLSTDVLGLETGTSRLTSYSDARGRLLMVGRLYAEPDRFLLEIPSDRIEPVRQQLAKYVLRADVRIEDVSNTLARCAAAGHSAAVALGAVVDSLPAEPGQSVISEAGARIVRLAGPRPRWQIHGEREAVTAVWDQLAGHTVEVDSSQWRLLDIEAGIPAVHEATAGHFVAQMLNLDRLGAIDFRKGCYPGQEVIARTHYLGRIKRRMQLLHLSMNADTPTPGTAVEQDGKKVGEVVEGAPLPVGGCLVLAVIHTGADDPLSIDGQAAERRPLPYGIEEEAA
ncbi:MAG: folate-binding protein [Halofilum sp. (in: g-proteobacteria)]|nr:folate-binding protein [Halofilum sp. (in: g-proteobacteria)]